MKTRFTALDIRAVVGDLSPRLIGLRLANVYDINQKTYLWKFAAGGEKVVLLTESGIRFHSTIYAHTKSPSPSGFAAKLRKHLKSRRLTGLRQLGFDRIIDMKFGDGEAAYHVLVELYSSGNIILTDHTYRILALLRSVTLEAPPTGSASGAKGAPGTSGTSGFTAAAATAARDAGADAGAGAGDEKPIEKVRIAVGEIYDVTLAREFVPMTRDRLKELLGGPPQPGPGGGGGGGLTGNGGVVDLSSVEHPPATAVDAGTSPAPALNPDPNVETPSDAKPPTGTKGKQSSGRKKDPKSSSQQQHKDGGKQSAKAEAKSLRTDGGAGGAGIAGGPTVKKWLKDKAGMDFAPVVIDHVLHLASVPATLRLGDLDTSDTSPDSQFVKLCEVFEQVNDMIVSRGTGEGEGWCVVKEVGKGEGEGAETPSAEAKGVGVPTAQAGPTTFGGTETPTTTHISPGTSDSSTLEEFHPFFPSHLSHLPLRRFPTFCAAADEFFSLLEHSRLRTRAEQAELAAKRRIDHTRKEHEARVAGLTAAQEQSVKVARAVERHLEEVERVLGVVRSYLAAGYDWRDLEREVEEGKKRGNPEAMMVEKLKLAEGIVIVKLPDPDFEDAESDDDEFDETESEDDSRDSNEEQHARHTKSDSKIKEEHKWLSVDLDLHLGGYANAKRFYDARRQALQKQEKTVAATSKALKASERKAAAEIRTAQAARVSATTARPQTLRKPYWFERFHWFVSSENYLVIGGRDAQQNEELVRKYLKPGDVYVHADLQGAPSVVIKNPYQFDATKDNALPPPPPGTSKENPVPPLTLSQAGTMAVREKEAEISVSKTDPFGEPLPLGAVEIKGKKNWLPPTQLVYGFALLFRVEDSNIPSHMWDRRPWARGDSVDDYKLAIYAASSVDQDDGEEEVLSTVEDDSLDKVLEEEEIEGTENEGTLVRKDIEVQQVPEESVETSSDRAKVKDDEDGELANDSGRKERHLQTTYGLNGEQVEEGQPPKQDGIDEVGAQGLTAATAGQGRRSNRPVTAKERRDLKKGRDVLSDRPNTGVKDIDTVPPMSEDQGKQSSQSGRGKRSKLKKKQDKYGDQDDDEKEMAKQLLGVKVQGQEQDVKKSMSVEKKDLGWKQHGQAGKSHPSSSSQAESGKKPSTPQSHRPQPSNRTLEDFGEEVDDEAARNIASQVAVVDQLTGTPLATDNLLYAVAVCGPWSALQRYNYKIKLTPGTVKRGKAAKSALQQFQRESQGQSPQEREAVRTVLENDAITAMLPKVKMVSGQNDIKGAKKSR
ncbi:hypothetical protein HDU93_009602 [Gonapodya sp. JEL0774]|nr:hypothetical protein HDU93_009602 [Gonapodya sp. JEL0774]